MTDEVARVRKDRVGRWEVEVLEDGAAGVAVGEDGEDAHGAAAGVADEDVDGEHALVSVWQRPTRARDRLDLARRREQPRAGGDGECDGTDARDRSPRTDHHRRSVERRCAAFDALYFYNPFEAAMFHKPIDEEGAIACGSKLETGTDEVAI
jgi:hypothetical protein